MIEDFSIASFQVLKAVDDVCVDGGLDLQPPLGPFLLKQVDRPHERGPAGFVRCPAKITIQLCNLLLIYKRNFNELINCSQANYYDFLMDFSTIINMIFRVLQIVNVGQSYVFSGQHDTGVDHRLVGGEPGQDLGRDRPEDHHGRQVEVPHHCATQGSGVLILQSN